MQKIIMNRGTGKTTRLIWESSIRKIPIICATESQVKYIKQLVERYNVVIPEPRSIYSIEHSLGMRLGDVLVDDIDVCMNVFLGAKAMGRIAIATMSPESYSDENDWISEFEFDPDSARKIAQRIRENNITLKDVADFLDIVAPKCTDYTPDKVSMAIKKITDKLEQDKK